MHRGIEPGVFCRARCLQNEFCKHSARQKNASILSCIRYFLQQMFEKHVFPSTCEATISISKIECWASVERILCLKLSKN